MGGAITATINVDRKVLTIDSFLEHLYGVFLNTIEPKYIHALQSGPEFGDIPGRPQDQIKFDKCKLFHNE